jgi:hypothetical protein
MLTSLLGRHQHQDATTTLLGLARSTVRRNAPNSFCSSAIELVRCPLAEDSAHCTQVGTLFVDLNSASPVTKQHAVPAVESRGGHCVEAGVMTSFSAQSVF